MAAVIVFALIEGEWSEDLRVLIGNPMGLATLVDAYVGFLLFATWVVYRESSGSVATLWVCLILAGGNLVTAIYVIVAAKRSRGDTVRFFLGHNHT